MAGKMCVLGSSDAVFRADASHGIQWLDDEDPAVEALMHAGHEH